MDDQFWFDKWNAHEIGFHKEQYHDKLLKYFPSLNPVQGQKVLVPLCGKTKDMLWLKSIGLKVDGVELVESAIQEFFKENKLSPVITTSDQKFKHFQFAQIHLRCGDFFELPEKDDYDYIYDRASLVALPQDMRVKYAAVVSAALKSQGKYLLIVYEYNQADMAGPPFSVSEEEIHKLYGKNFKIQLIDSGPPLSEAAKLTTLPGLLEKVYLLKKN